MMDTKKQLQLLTYKIVQLLLEIISCSCSFKYRILQLIAIPALAQIMVSQGIQMSFKGDDHW